VILEEIGMYDDMPGFLVMEKAMEVHFQGHPLSQSVLGSVQSVSELTVDQMRGYFRDRYRAGNIILAAAGNIDWDELVALSEKHCAGWPSGAARRSAEEAAPAQKSLLLPKALNQQHIVQMGAAPGATDRLRFAAELVSVVVGDDSGSRLYWELVDPGEAESADLSFNDYEGTGIWMGYVCSDPERMSANLSRIQSIYEDINRNGVTPEELEQARNKVASRVVLQSERPMGRLSSLGGNWMYREEYRTVAADLDELAAVTADDVRELLDRYPLVQTTTVGIGPLEAL
jgi:predicted Zn-dependent peptidase